MDEVVFEEFKGTGNLELRLDRQAGRAPLLPGDRYPGAARTRREELLLDEKTLRGVWLVRRMTAMISQNSPNQLEATERLLERLARTTSNEEFLDEPEDGPLTSATHLQGFGPTNWGLPALARNATWGHGFPMVRPVRHEQSGCAARREAYGY